jgi:L-glyceraldehyde 3-phosphate reductase
MVRGSTRSPKARGQTMAQLAIAWVLRHPQMTSALIGASKVSQVEDCAGAVRNLSFTADELAAVEAILHGDDEPPVW